MRELERCHVLDMRELQRRSIISNQLRVYVNVAGKLGLGSYIRFLTLPRAYGQIIMRLLTGQRKNKFCEGGHQILKLWLSCSDSVTDAWLC